MPEFRFQNLLYQTEMHVEDRKDARMVGSLENSDKLRHTFRTFRNQTDSPAKPGIPLSNLSE